MLEISFVIEPNCVWLAFIVSIDFGISYLKDKKGKLIAKSIVDSGHYKNKRQYADVLIYMGEGGNPNIS